jgi:hypothetical protein
MSKTYKHNTRGDTKRGKQSKRPKKHKAASFRGAQYNDTDDDQTFEKFKKKK